MEAYLSDRRNSDPNRALQFQNHWREDMEKKLLRPDEAAAFLCVSKWTIYRWVGEGRLKATKVSSGCLRIFSDSVDALVERNRTEDGKLSHP